MILSTIAFSAPSADCQQVNNLALGLHLDKQQPSIYSAVRVDCCSASGVTCDSSSRVIKIDWSGMKLDGSIQDGAFPTSLTELRLMNQSIAGPIPTLPESMQILYLGMNKFSGEIPKLPEGLKVAALFLNGLTGNLPTFPSTLSEFYVGYNAMNGELPKTLPSSLTTLHLNNNKFTGIFPGSFPENMTLVANGNKFTGSLSMGKPNTVMIQDNLVTDIKIQDTSFLIACNISDNPLAGSANALALKSKCAEDGFFPADVGFKSGAGFHAQTALSLVLAMIYVI